MQVTVLGATGFIGKHVTAALRARGDEVRTASLREPAAAAAAAAGSDAVINLAGEPLAQRWTSAVKQRIRSSRAHEPADFLRALARFGSPPRTYVTASAIGYYGTSNDASFTESSPPGSDFLAEVCVEWEQVAQDAREFATRVACVRTGLALGADGGALEKILPLFKAGTGGRVGSGKQWHSWIHIRDLVTVYLLALDTLDGPVNATAPYPVRNEEFTHALARAVHRPAALPVPAFALKMMLGEGATILLEGQRVLPKRLLDDGFAFRFQTFEEAIADIVS